MSRAEIITIIIAGAALIISFIALYIGQINGFRGKAYPSNQMVLSWDLLNGDLLPNMIISIEYINTGAKVGKIDNLTIQLCGNNASVIACKPLLVFPDGIDLVPDYSEIDDDINTNSIVENGIEVSGNSRQWMNVWIAPRSYKQETVLLHPVSDFKLNSNIRYKLQLYYSQIQEVHWIKNILFKDKTPTISWKQSKIIYHYQISNDDLKAWLDDHKSIRVEADEINDSWSKYQDQK